MTSGKQQTMIAGDDDFGFTAISDEEFKQREVEAAKKAASTVEDRVQRMKEAIMPLLNNLMKDADKKEYIFWPDRKTKIEAFISKLEKIASSDGSEQ